MIQSIYENIMIYGCGINGIHLYYRIRDEYNIIAFVDKSEGKHGYVLGGVRCISIDELEDYDRGIRIIVSIEHPKSVISDLVSRGFRNVCPLEDLGFKEGHYKEIVSVDSLLRMKRVLERGLSDEYKEDFDIIDTDIIEIIEDFKERNKNENCRGKLHRS